MFKTCFLINSPGEPFKFKGLDAEKAILSVFPDINAYPFKHIRAFKLVVLASWLA